MEVLKMVGWSRKNLKSVFWLFLFVAAVGLGAKTVSADINNAGTIKISNVYSKNTDIFDSDAYIKSYSIISGTGQSPYSEYVIYSQTRPNDSTNPVWLYYTYAYFNIDELDRDDGCARYNASGNSRLRVELMIDFQGTAANPDRTFRNTARNAGICANTEQSIVVPAAAFSQDPISGLWRAHFTTDLRYQYRNNGWKQARGDINSIRLAYHLRVNPGKYMSYGDVPGNNNGVDGVAETTVMAGQTNGNDDSARLPFGLPCTDRVARRVSLYLYDSDNRDDNQKNARISIYKMAAGGSTYSPIGLRGGGDENVSINDPYTDGKLFRNSNTVYRPGNGSNRTVTVTLTAQPGAKYYLLVMNINSPRPNFYRIGLPTDGIYGSSNFSCPTWSIDGSVTPRNAGGTTITTASPGQTVYFDYRLWNTGPDTSTSINYNAGGTTGAQVLTASQNIQPRPVEAVPIPSGALNGTTYCRTLSWNPTTQNGGSGTRSACVTVSYTYTLTPVVTPSSSVIVPGDSVSFTTSVSKDITTVNSNATTWTLRRFIAPSGAAIPTGVRTTGSFNCAYYLSNGLAEPGSCDESLSGGTGTSIFTNPSTEVGTSANRLFSSADTASLTIGQRVCFALYINSRTQTANQPAEVVNCAVVAKYPALEVQQGMVRTGGAFSSSGVCQLSAPGERSGILMHNYGTSATDRGSRGLAALAIGPIRNFGSRNNVYGPDIWTRNLLFANNATASAQHGLFLGTLSTGASTFCLPNMTGLYTGRGSGASPTSVTSLTTITPTASANYTLTSASSVLELSGTTLNANQQVIIRVTGTGTVRLTGDILYSSSATNLGAGQRVPHFVLLVDGTAAIQVANTVRELNGIYSTRGNIYTCTINNAGTWTFYDGSPAKQMTNNDCNQPLLIKGALVGNQVLPYRTAGYDSTNATDLIPAETFRLTPEALIGDYQYSQDSPIIRTVRQRELPARL